VVMLSQHIKFNFNAPNKYSPSVPLKESFEISRRSILTSSIFGLLYNPCEAHASLVQFPANSLRNTYWLVRAGISYGEESNITVTNPVWKQAVQCSLSKYGARQVYQRTLPRLRALGACEGSCWIWPSITQNSYQTAEILADQLGMGRSRIVPEYSFLDKRGLGALEDLPLEEAEAEVQSADTLDSRWKPVAGTDGTPNESMQDVLVRIRQVMSVTETQYSGEDVILVAPDSYTLSALQAAVLGVDLRQHAGFTLSPGEVRRLALGDSSYDVEPRQFSCPDPPKCLKMRSPSNGSSGASQQSDLQLTIN
jgi:broad specificity phosphatase PhoE